MVTVAYGSPFVPVEWLAAHGLQPRWLRPPPGRCAGETDCDPAQADRDERRELREWASLVSGRRGVCPLAAAIVDAVSSTAESAAVVLTTSCDQMRYVASLLEYQHASPVFVMNVPSTWQTEASRSLYLAELQRLSRFLVTCGGKSPSPAELADVMVQFDLARAQWLQTRNLMSAKAFAAALIRVRETSVGPGRRTGPEGGQHRNSARQPPSGGREPPEVPLALAGGPLPESDYELFDWIQQAGGRIVLDATEWGERTLPRPFDVERTQRDPLGELADAYFGAIPDVFRRPHGELYEYLGRELASRQVRGLIVRRYLWCDLWHAEVAQIKARSPTPVLDLDAAGNEDSGQGRTRGRVEAFLEMLR